MPLVAAAAKPALIDAFDVVHTVEQLFAFATVKQSSCHPRARERQLAPAMPLNETPGFAPDRAS